MKQLLYENLGMTLTQAVKMFFKKSIIDGGLPFHPHIRQPNKDTLAAIEEVETGKAIKAKNVSSIFENLDELDVRC